MRCAMPLLLEEVLAEVLLWADHDQLFVHHLQQGAEGHEASAEAALGLRLERRRRSSR